MHFDWYQATIDAQPKDILEMAITDLPNAHDVERFDRGGSGYKSSAAVKDRQGDTITTLLYNSKSAGPNLRGTSTNAVAVSEFIRKNWPVHSVSRLDVAEDMSGDGLFERIQNTMRFIAEASGLDSGLSFIPDILEKGRTYRVGAPSSATMVRLYEKGLETASKGRAALEEVDRNLCRLEIQCRPQKEAKKRFATLQPEEAWGSSKWTKELALFVMQLDVERLYLRPREESDLERTTAHVISQYLNHALKHGEVLAREEFGLTDSTYSDRITLWCEHLMAAMIRVKRGGCI